MEGSFPKQMIRSAIEGEQAHDPAVTERGRPNGFEQSSPEPRLSDERGFFFAKDKRWAVLSPFAFAGADVEPQVLETVLVCLFS